MNTAPQSPAPADQSARLRALWELDPSITFLNHGSFGACPRHVLAYQSELRRRIEREPVLFLARQLEAELDGARAALADFVGVDADDLAFVNNATTGVNTIVNSLHLAPGDELLTTDHVYNACHNTLRRAAERFGAHVVVATLPWPLGRDADAANQAIVAALDAKVTPRTRLALIDHVTSPTGVILPVAAIAARLESRGVPVLIDGAHAPGMVPLDVDALGATYYTGNCHKWLCAPKGAAFLWVRRSAQADIHPTVTSHGFNAPGRRSRFRLEFDFMGTDDPTAFLCVPECLRTLAELLPGGWAALMSHNHTMALHGRDLVAARAGLAPPAPDALLGSLAALPLPEMLPAGLNGGEGDGVSDPLQGRLFEEFHIEVPVFTWPKAPRRLLRLSAQVYNSTRDYEALAGALATLLGRN